MRFMTLKTIQASSAKMNGRTICRNRITTKSRKSARPHRRLNCRISPSHVSTRREGLASEASGGRSGVDSDDRSGVWGSSATGAKGSRPGRYSPGSWVSPSLEALSQAPQPLQLDWSTSGGLVMPDCSLNWIASC